MQEVSHYLYRGSWGGGGGGWGGGERVRKATITGNLAINLNNGVKVINQSTLETVPNLYLCKFCSRLKSYVDFIEIFT